MMTGPETHGLFGLLKGAVEKFELKVLARDAEVGPAHQALSPMAGRWAGTMKTWLSPGDPYDVQHVTSTVQWTLGNRFLEQRFDGLFLGQPFSALCLTGYDDAAGRYEASWMDSATTAMLSLAGAMDPASKVLTLFGSMKLTAIPGTTVDIRSTIAMNGDNGLRYEISIGRFGLWVKAHEIDLTRSASS
jgi:hypothetical protein